MLKHRSSGRTRNLVTRLRGNRTTLTTIALVLSLLAGGAALVRRGGSASPSENNASQVTPASLTPGSPAKEYIYAGGRLIATEEPAGAPTPPPAPAGLVATPGNTQVTLSWNASSGATSYNVKRSTINGGPYSTIAPAIATTNYTNTGLTNGTTYYYVVSASNGAGEGLQLYSGKRHTNGGTEPAADAHRSHSNCRQRPGVIELERIFGSDQL